MCSFWNTEYVTDETAYQHLAVHRQLDVEEMHALCELGFEDDIDGICLIANSPGHKMLNTIRGCRPPPEPSAYSHIAIGNTTYSHAIAIAIGSDVYSKP